MVGRGRRGRQGRGVSLGAQAERDQRKRIDLAVGIEILFGLEPLQSVGGGRIPTSVGLFGLEVALGGERLLDLAIAVRRGGKLAIAPSGSGAFGGRFLAAFGRGRRRLRISSCLLTLSSRRISKSPSLPGPSSSSLSRRLRSTLAGPSPAWRRSSGNSSSDVLFYQEKGQGRREACPVCCCGREVSGRCSAGCRQRNSNPNRYHCGRTCEVP